MTRRRRACQLAALVTLAGVASLWVMACRAQRFERAYNRIHLGMPFAEAAAILEALPGRYDSPASGLPFREFEDSGEYAALRAVYPGFVVGPGMTDYIDLDAERVYCRLRYWRDDDHMILLCANETSVIGKGLAAAPPVHKVWISKVRSWLGI